MVSKVVISTSEATEDVALLCGALELRLFTTLGYNFRGGNKHSVQSKVLEELV